jgi:ParB-like chromosome segregation protein Spo0J
MENGIHFLVEAISKLNDDEKISAINKIKIALHEISPMKNEPVDCVLWVRSGEIEANDYNPNSVAPPEMELLRVSINNDGYTQPIVTFSENSHFTVVDGYHRNRVGRECADIKERIMGYLPITIIRSDREDRGDRIAATIRHNRARGKHLIEGMSQIVLELKRRNWSNEKIGRELGMDPDEILRLSQITGLAEMFKDKDFSEAWEVQQINEEDTLEISEEKSLEIKKRG